MLILSITIPTIIFYGRIIPVVDILRVAVNKSTIKNESYILCKHAKTTGFEWIMVEDMDGNKAYEFCNIVGESPFTEIEAHYEFIVAGNTFIFYVEDRNEYYHEGLGTCVDYSVSGWDILYPVKHGSIEGFLQPARYITKKDTVNK